MLNTEIESLALELRTLIGKSRTVTDTTSFNEVFIIAEQIIGILAYLISPTALLEQRYRQKVVEYMSEGDSATKANFRAKATDEYVEYIKYSALADLAHEQVMLLKKFKNRLEDEYHHS